MRRRLPDPASPERQLCVRAARVRGNSKIPPVRQSEQSCGYQPTDPAVAEEEHVLDNLWRWSDVAVGVVPRQFDDLHQVERDVGVRPELLLKRRSTLPSSLCSCNRHGLQTAPSSGCERQLCVVSGRPDDHSPLRLDRGDPNGKPTTR